MDRTSSSSSIRASPSADSEDVSADDAEEVCEAADAEETDDASDAADDASDAEDAEADDAADDASETALLLSDEALPDAVLPLFPQAARARTQAAAVNNATNFFFITGYPSFQAASPSSVSSSGAASFSDPSVNTASNSLYVLISVTAILRYSSLASTNPGVSSSAVR